MQFDTPAEYRRHLKALIDDPSLIEQAVRKKFPVRSTGSRMSEMDFNMSGRRKPASPYDPWMASEASDRAHERNMREGSAQLLRAVNRELSAMALRRSRRRELLADPAANNAVWDKMIDDARGQHGWADVP